MDLEPYGSPEHSEWLDVDWKAHRHSVTVNGTRVNYVRMGAGPVVLFIHGLAGSWHNWLENIPNIARDHTAIAVDLPGFGDSESPRGGVSISGYAAFVSSFLDELGVGQAAVVGSSMGGMIAAATAAAAPARGGSGAAVRAAAAKRPDPQGAAGAPHEPARAHLASARAPARGGRRPPGIHRGAACRVRQRRRDADR